MHLLNKFKNNNCDEIRESTKKERTAFDSFRYPNNENLPALFFTSKKKIEDGYYDFRIGDLSFMNCYIYAHSKDNNGKIVYCGGNYKLVMDI